MEPMWWLLWWNVVAVVGVWSVQSGWRQPRPGVSVALERLTAPVGGRPGRMDVVRQRVRLLPWSLDDIGLRLIDQSADRYVLAGLGRGAQSLVVSGIGAIALAVAGVLPPVLVPVVTAVAVVGAVAFYLAQCNAEASAARQAIRHELSAYLDVVAMLLSGDSGYEGALRQAADTGDGQLFRELRRRMHDTTRSGRSLVEVLEQTGEWFGVDEIVQVSTTLTISAAEGAPVARSLAASCSSLRAALSAEQETEARLRTSRLTLPLVSMALMFMAVVIYPALAS